MPTTKKEQLIENTIEYKNRMAEEKLRRITLQNDHQNFDLQKKKETICYKNVAMSEFEKAVSSIYAQIKNADEQLTALLRLDQNQADLLHDYMQNILEDLSNIDIQLSDTNEFDAAHYYDGKAKRSMILN